jgi:hypothetical protein
MRRRAEQNPLVKPMVLTTLIELGELRSLEAQATDVHPTVLFSAPRPDQRNRAWV